MRELCSEVESGDGGQGLESEEYGECGLGK